MEGRSSTLKSCLAVLDKVAPKDSDKVSVHGVFSVRFNQRLNEPMPCNPGL